MPLFGRHPPVDLQTVLELERQPDGSARGRVEGLAVILERPLQLWIAYPGTWPEEVDILDPPRESHRFLLGRSVRNGSRRRRWMTRAFAQPEVTKALGNLRLGGAQLEVEDQALLLRWRTPPEGPQASFALRSAVRLAQVLPRAMRDAVDGRTWAAEAKPLTLPKEVSGSLFGIDLRYERKKLALRVLVSLCPLVAVVALRWFATVRGIQQTPELRNDFQWAEVLSASFLVHPFLLFNVPCAWCRTNRAVRLWAIFQRAPACKQCGLVPD